MLKFSKWVGEKEAVLLSQVGWSRPNNNGFTMLEIMIVVGVIGLLAAIAIPNFVNARARTQGVNCSNNIRQFEAAKAQYALECGLKDGDSIEPASALNDYLVNLTVDTLCPAGGTYLYIATIGTSTTCSIHSN
jgi:prepilin-type N-terminal cleavage/methylation domain-containing protein